MKRTSLGLLCALTCLVSYRPALAQREATAAALPQPTVYVVEPGPDAQYRLQARLIAAIPGDVIQLEEGRYSFQRQIDISKANLTLRGRGSGKTILSFAGQDAGGQGIESTGDNFVVEALAVEDTSGNGIKVLGARNVTFRDVRVEWTGGPRSSNGAYAIYPVQCQNVLVENCAAFGASDAGLYVGQCHDVVVRRCRAERNVAGIEIENTVRADVYDNVATDNAGGILVFDLPGLQVKGGRDVRVFRNRVFANNHKNFAPPGNIVAGIPSGTGVMVMATDNVEIFENQIADNQTANLSLVSYLLSGKKIGDASYDPYSESISVHDNEFTGGGNQPSGAIGRLLAPVLGQQFPDILFDGLTNPEKAVEHRLPISLRHSIRGNGAATFVNFQFPKLSPESVASGSYEVDRDLSGHAHVIPPLSPVQLKPHDAPRPGEDRVSLIYRTAKRKLSEYGFFQGDLAKHVPRDGVFRYELNTPLFSDYTTKYRFVRLPDGEPMRYRASEVVEFPVGTAIAKTFSYLRDLRDPSQGEHLLETRIELREEDGWYGFSYLWNEEQTDADLVLGGSQLTATWVHSDGSVRTNNYEVPNANQCLNCHGQVDGFEPLGPTAANLNRVDTDGHHNQLAAFTQSGQLVDAPPLEEMPKLASAYHEPSGSLDARARAWLDVNCAHCHNPRGSARTSGLDLRRMQRDPAKYGVWKSPVAAGRGSGGREYDIVPGHPDKSILLFRIESTDPGIRMPSVARRLVPTEGVALVRQWISQLDDVSESETSSTRKGG